ncbi:hypothetical protein [Vreelandella sp. EE22]
MAASFSALAGPETPGASSSDTSMSEDSQERLQDVRARYEERRDRLTGADKLPPRTQKVGSFHHAPVDTRDAPDQTAENSSR